MMGKKYQTVQPGERTNAEGKPVSNKMLLSASDDEYNAIRPHLLFAELPSHFSLYEPVRRMKFAYFLNRGLASLVVATREGRAVEAGVVGNEGMVGTPLLVGLHRSPLRKVMQIDGDGFRIAARALQAALRVAPNLRMALNRYAVLQGMQVAQTAACNRLHDVGRRLAPWLLMAQDRVDAGALPITHEFLATMLGTDRPTVTLAAGILQRKGAIRYSRGIVRVLNRKKLEGSACECYRVIQQFNGHLGLK